MNEDGNGIPRQQDAASPTHEEAGRLYLASKAFGELAPWRWMDEDELFAVHDTPSGLTGYCTVLGELGEVLALAVYPGDQGYACFRRLSTGVADGEDFEVAVAQDCLLASFEDRKALDARDRAALAGLGLKFRGGKAWPLLRSYRPGYAPWYLVRSEARLLATALEQALEVCARVEGGFDVLAHVEEGLILTRRWDAGRNDWTDGWESPPAPATPRTARPERARLGRLRARAQRSSAQWEVALFYLPGIVMQGDERPYYPRLWLCVDRHEGFVLTADPLEPGHSAAELQEAFLSALERARTLPAEVHVIDGEVSALMEPLAGPLGIRLRRVSRLPHLDRARRSLADHLRL